MDHEHLTAMLSRLQLTAIRDQLDSLLDEAGRRQMSPPRKTRFARFSPQGAKKHLGRPGVFLESLRETLYFLCEREIARKDERRIQMGMSIAHFPRVATLEGFDYAAQPSVDARQIRELSTSRWIAHGENLLFLGPPGVGKTHLAIALGREAILAGYSTLFVTAPALLAALARAHGEGRLEEKLAHFAKPKLLIVDELGYLPFEANAAHLFFQLISRRYERGSLLITSNRTVGEWGVVFGDAIAATAILDRLLHHSHVVTIRGESYRLKDKRRSGVLPRQHPGSAESVSVHQPA